MERRAVVKTDRKGACRAAGLAARRLGGLRRAGTLEVLDARRAARASLRSSLSRSSGSPPGPPEVVLLDAAGDATPVRRTVATDALLKFLADRTRPPDVAVVRFTRDFLHLALGRQLEHHRRQLACRRSR